MRIQILLLAALFSSPAWNADIQDASQTSTPSTGNAQPAAPAAHATPAACSPKTKLRPGFLIIGTVFNEHALSFPGTVIHIRCAGDKKYRWETVSNSRGEFAVRVPEGHSYEVLVQAKNYREQNVGVRTDNGDIQQRLSIRLQPANPPTGGAAQ